MTKVFENIPIPTGNNAADMETMKYKLLIKASLLDGKDDALRAGKISPSKQIMVKATKLKEEEEFFEINIDPYEYHTYQANMALQNICLPMTIY